MLETKLVTSNLGLVNPASMDDYLARGGYRALTRVVREGLVAEIVDALKSSGLIGRGGAAFPTGLKRELAMKAELTQPYPAPTNVPAPYRHSSAFVVCNADESETGTFKDRVLMEGDPFRIIEGMTITAFITCATNGFIYLRGEYPLAYERLSRALDVARQRGYLGERILRDDFDFHIEIRRGAGAYICGEETALFESIEGKRGEPRVKPPFPTDQGLFNRPTVINNVETFANIPFIALAGADAYRKFGTAKSPGTRIVCVSGHVQKPGAYEIAMGVSLRDVIENLAGGLRPGRALKAILIGGAAGVFLRPDEIDVPLDFQSLAAIGATLGSGAIMALDDTAEMRGVLKRLARFFRDESCGKCFPCQLGTQRQYEIIAREGETFAERATSLLRELGATMRDASLCGLGQTASSAIVSAFEKGLV
ncbi:MAG: SLBB domain-containing protein [Chloroflexi bacterium]|nr:SLBB domain-containing protein [Chloroflexota bacterium]